MNSFNDFKSMFFDKNKNMKKSKKTEKIHTIISVVLALCILILEIVILPSLFMTSFVNRNTAGYMLFDIPMDDQWNAPSKYVWTDDDESYVENVNEKWDEALSDVFVGGYGYNYYTTIVSRLISVETGTPYIEVYNTFKISEFADYCNEYIRRQAGFLIGDNMLPTANCTQLQEYFDKAILLTQNEIIIEWCKQNSDVFVATVKNSMQNSNNYFTEKAMQSQPDFYEVCLTLKIINMFILFYVLISLIVIILFCMIKVFKTKYTYFMLMLSQIFSAITSILIYSNIKNFSLIIFDIPYNPTAGMISDVFPIFIIVLIVQIAASVGLFFASEYGKKLFKRSYITK